MPQFLVVMNQKSLSFERAKFHVKSSTHWKKESAARKGNYILFKLSLHFKDTCIGYSISSIIRQRVFFPFKTIPKI